MQSFGSGDATAPSDGFLAHLPPAAAERLLDDAIAIDVPAGSILYREEERPRILLVQAGLLRVFMRSAAGRQVTLRYARPGDVVGLALAAGGPAAVSVQAVTAASVLGLRVETMSALMASDAAVGRACAGELARQLLAAYDRAANNTFLGLRQRVMVNLLDLAEPRPGHRLAARVTQQELADAVGSAREAVARILHDLRNEGLIATRRDRILLLEASELARRAAAR